MALGVDGACSYLSGGRSGLSTGDVLLIGTDGIWETQNANSEKFGKERIGKILMRHHRQSAEGILQAVLKALEDVSREGAAGRRHHPSGPEVNGNRPGLSAWPAMAFIRLAMRLR